MNKTQLVNYVSRKTKLPRQSAWMVVDTTLDCIKRYTKSRDGVKLTGFGNFKCISEKPHKKWNTRTKRYSWTKPSKSIQFSPNKSYRECVMK